MTSPDHQDYTAKESPASSSPPDGISILDESLPPRTNQRSQGRARRGEEHGADMTDDDDQKWEEQGEEPQDQRGQSRRLSDPGPK